MRIAVVGTGNTANALRVNLRMAKFAVVESRADYTVIVEETSVPGVVFDSVDCPMETEILRAVRKLTKGRVEIQTAGGTRSDRDVRIEVGPGEQERRAVEIGVYRGLSRFMKMPEARVSWWKRFGLLFVLAVVVRAQPATPVTFLDAARNRITAGSSADNALRVVCVNPVSHATESCAGSSGPGGGGDMNLTGVNGVAPSVGTGATDSGTLRVVLGATQPTLTFGLPTGAASSALQTTGNSSLSSIDSKLPAALVGGKLSVDPGTVAVTGTFWQTTQPVSAVALPLPSNAAQETGGNLATIVTNTNKIPSSPATDRATAAAPFSFRLSDGSAFYNALTDTQLRASAVPVSDSVVDTAPDTQNITAADVA